MKSPYARMGDEDGGETSVENDVDLTSTASRRKAGLALSLVSLLYIGALVTTVPLLGQYIHSRVSDRYLISTDSNVTVETCTKNVSKQYRDTEEKIQKEAARLTLLYSLSGSIPAVFINIVIGSYSDYLGRRPAFVFPIAGSILKNMISCIIIKENLSMNTFYLAYFLEGLSGSYSTFFLAVFSYTADMTRPDTKRTLAIAIMEGICAVAASIAQIIVGYLIKGLGFFYAALFTLLVFTLGVISVLTLLPETLGKKEKKVWAPWPHIKKVFGFYTYRGTIRRRLTFILGICIFFFGLISNLGRSNIETLYQLNAPFCWDSLKIGFYQAIRMASSVIISVVGIKLLQPFLRDEIIALVGMIFMGVSFVVEAFAVSDWMMYIVPIIGLIGFAVTPIIRSILSRMVSRDEQGAIFSSIAVAEAICNTISMVLYNEVYKDTVDSVRGAVFLMMTGFCALNIVVLILFSWISRQENFQFPDKTITKHIESKNVQKEDNITESSA